MATVSKRFLYFVKLEDAKRRFPRAKLAYVFTGINGWLWTKESIAKKKAFGGRLSETEYKARNKK